MKEMAPKLFLDVVEVVKVEKTIATCHLLVNSFLWEMKMNQQRISPLVNVKVIVIMMVTVP